MAHLTCTAHTRTEIEGALKAYREIGVENIMALRGDPPKGETTFHPPPGGFRYAAELVSAIGVMDHFGIGVAGYPEGHAEAPDYPTDLGHQVDKIATGADFVVSQFFLDNGHFLRWRDDLRGRGIEVPLMAGILPPQSLGQITAFAGFCGVAVPQGLRAVLEPLADDPESSAAAGIDHARSQIEALIAEGVDGIHLYALNKLAPIQALAGLVKG